MNDHAKKWVEALRSGRFPQARQALRKEDGYCPLGVGCELYRLETGKGRWERWTSYPEARPSIEGSVSAVWVFVTARTRTQAHAPHEVRHWLGLRTGYGNIPGRGSLAAINDQGATFERIAEIIESEPEGLFVA